MRCPLCHKEAEWFLQSRQRDFFLCAECGYIGVPPAQHLPEDLEISRYLEHDNNLANEGYVRMFEEKLDLIARHCPGADTVLDFGCGYEPVLKTLLERRGYRARVYDRYFFPDWDPARRFDLVISTETFEHLHQPAAAVDRVLTVLNPGGHLAVMTRLYPEREGRPDRAAFADWYYKNDPTHIGFFSLRTFAWIASSRRLRRVFHNEKDFVILKSG